MENSKKKLIWSWILIALSILPLIIGIIVSISSKQMLEELEGAAAIFAALFGALFLVIGLVALIVAALFNAISLLLMSLAIFKDKRKEAATLVPFNVSIALIVVPLIFIIVSLI